MIRLSSEPERKFATRPVKKNRENDDEIPINVEVDTEYASLSQHLGYGVKDKKVRHWSDGSSSSAKVSTQSSTSTREVSVEIIEERHRDATGVKRVTATYRKGRLLGKGGFARCYAFTDCKLAKFMPGKVVEKASLKKPRQSKNAD